MCRSSKDTYKDSLIVTNLKQMIVTLDKITEIKLTVWNWLMLVTCTWNLRESYAQSNKRLEENLQIYKFTNLINSLFIFSL